MKVLISAGQSLKYARSSSLSALLAISILSAGLLAVAAADASDIQFEDMTPWSGIDHGGESWGASWGDFNGDGYPDLFASNHRMRPALWVYNRNGTFSEISRQVDSTGKWDRLPEGDTHGASWADFDNDGDQDLILSAGGTGGTQFFVNEAGSLVERTAEFRADIQYSGGRLPVWFDYNNDGHLDFMMAFKNRYAQLMRNESTRFRNVTSSYMSCRDDHYGELGDLALRGRLQLLCGPAVNFPDKLYDYISSPFTNLTSLLPSVKPVIDTVIADFNGDLRPDVFLVRGFPHITDTVQSGPNSIESHLAVGGKSYRAFSFKTTGVVTFDIDWSSEDQGVTDVTAIRVSPSKWSPGATHFTLDPADPATWGTPTYNPYQDRGIYIGYDPGTSLWRVDLSAGYDWSTASILVDSTAPVSKVKPIHVLATEKEMPPVLLMNTTSGFADGTLSAGVGTPIKCISAVAADFDNDMDQDLFITCRGGTSNIADILYENQGNGTFVAVPAAGGAAGVVGTAVHDHAGTGDSVVAADYDADGFMDLLVTNGVNMRPLHNGGPYQLFHNAGNANHWIELDLRGTTSNRDGIGAIVYATAGGVTQLREQNGGYHRWSQNHQRLHFGLGANTSVSTLQVKWPNGTINTYSNVEPDHLYRVTQNGALEIIPLDPDTAGLQCRQPTYDPAVEGGLFVWKDCDTGTWHAQFAAGGIQRSTSGSVVSDQAFTSVVPVSIESQFSDVVDNTTDPNVINYVLNVNNAGTDGFDFTYPQGASVCLGIGAPNGATAKVGYAGTVVTLPFDLKTLQPCGG